MLEWESETRLGAHRALMAIRQELDQPYEPPTVCDPNELPVADHENPYPLMRHPRATAPLWALVGYLVALLAWRWYAWLDSVSDRAERRRLPRARK